MFVVKYMLQIKWNWIEWIKAQDQTETSQTSQSVFCTWRVNKGPAAEAKQIRLLCWFGGHFSVSCKKFCKFSRTSFFILIAATDSDSLRDNSVETKMNRSSSAAVGVLTNTNIKLPWQQTWGCPRDYELMPSALCWEVPTSHSESESGEDQRLDEA